jgi:hypothetical protein
MVESHYPAARFADGNSAMTAARIEQEHLLDLAYAPDVGVPGSCTWYWDCLCGRSGDDPELRNAVHNWIRHKERHLPR